MRIFNKLSLKMRITVFTGLIVLLSSVVLTLLSMHNASDNIVFIAEGYIPPNYIGTETGNVSSELSPIPEETGSLFEAPPLSLSDTDMPAALAQNAIDKFNVRSICYMMLISIISMLLVYWTAGKCLKPVQDLNQTILNITKHNLGERLPDSKSDDEVSSLTSSFNAMLDRLDKSYLDQKCFSQNAAHELKTPVATIKTSLQVLELDVNPSIEDYKESIDVIRRTTNRMSNIIEDLLTLTNEEFDHPMETVSLDAMLVRAVNDILPNYSDKRLNITYNFMENETFIMCAEGLADRIFRNLVENAMKYNKIGGNVDISISDSGNIISTSISDTGIGIAEEDLDKIWNAFYCVDPSRSRKSGGTGLGLSIVKALAQKLNWEISADSKVGEGSTFTVSFNNNFQGDFRK